MKELTQHQVSAIDHLKKWRVGALFMEPGTGKTRVAVEIIRSCYDVDLVLWLGPLRTIRTENGIKSVKDEVDKWGGFSSRALYVGVESIGGSDRIYLETLNEISKYKRVFCVVDESLKIKNYQAKRTRRIIHIGEQCHYRVILNGTPITRNINDVWAQMQFLSPKILNMSYAQYERTFCKMTVLTKKIGGRKMWDKKIITGYENVDYLYSLIRHYIYQCDLHLNITQQYSTMCYYISDIDRQEYDSIKEFYLSLDTLMSKNDNIFLEMTQKMQHSYCITEDKFRCVDSIVEKNKEENCVIFCKYIVSAEECKKRYPKALVMSYQKSAYGLNLQDYNVTVYFDKVWDYALRMQSSRRTYRTGQERDCHYYDLTGNVGLERLIDKNIEKKIGMSEYFKRATINDLRKDL